MKKHALIATSLAILMGSAAGVAGAQSAAVGPNGEMISSTGPGSNSGSVEPNSPMARGSFSADGSTARPEEMVSSSTSLDSTSTSGTTTEQPATSSYGSEAQQPQPATSTYGTDPQQQAPAPSVGYQPAPQSAPMDSAPATSPQGTVEPSTAPAPMR